MIRLRWRLLGHQSLTFDKTIMNSRSLAAIATVALTTASTLFARIGETEQECAARYGEPIKKFPDNSLAYQKSGLAIIITFFNGKADSVLI